MSVAVAVAAASLAAWLVVRSQLLGKIDEQLSQQIPSPPADPPERVPVFGPPDAEGDAAAFLQDRYIQVVDSSGTVLNTYDDRELPVSDRSVAVAGAEAQPFFETVEVDGDPVRLYTTPLGEGSALQVGQSLVDTESTLERLAFALAGVSLVGIGLAIALGRMTAATAMGPVHRLSLAAEKVARTGDPAHPIETKGNDELSRLAGTFNTMLGALDASLRRQRALVGDASHELRTPVTSIRTNAEILQRSDLADVERGEVLADIVAETEEMTQLLAALLDSARFEETSDPMTSVRLDEVAEHAVAIARRRHPQVRFRVDARPTDVIVMRDRVERAVANLVDNAAKWSPPGGEVDVRVETGCVSVRDRGPGIAPDDLERVFDRFWRSAADRGRPGVGLGLAIVKQVAEDHGGTVTAANAEGGGALFELCVGSQTDLR